MWRMVRKAGYFLLLIVVTASTVANFVPEKVSAAPDIPLANTNPADYTPNVIGTAKAGGDTSDPKAVNELLRVGNYMYAGGIVNIVKQPNFPTENVFSNIFRFNPVTGVIDTAFKPQLLGKDGTRESGEVYALETSSDGKSLYIGGRFTSVGGAPVTGIVKWNLVTNTRDTSFNPRLTLGVNRPATVYDLKMLNGRLFVASDATHIEVNGTKVNGSALMAIHPLTGARTSYINLAITETIIDPTISTYSSGALRVEKIAINPQGTRAVFIGNFRKVNASTRLQIAMIDLGTTSTTLAPWYPANIMNFSTVLPNSTTAPGTSPCLPQLSMCMRDVDWNPTGSSFVLCTTGGGGTSVYPSLRDSISLWPNSNSTNATPDWVNYTDNDTFLSCRATTNYIYAGGHFKNLNFTVYRAGVKQTSAAYAPQTHYGIGAINASTGSAVASFNNGTSTGRGYGWAGMYVSPTSQGAGAGLWVGGDSDGVMGENHRRLGLFPL